MYMKPIVEFLNHGILPFTGRKNEMDDLLQFCRNLLDGQELRLLLLTGEAGVGKSRLVEESIRNLESADFLPIHIRIYPDTALSVVSLLAAAINHSRAVRPLLREELQPNAGSVLSGLRRLARLRSVVLFVEDIHLLTGESLGEFARLCSALFNEPLAIVCAARPVSGEVRSVVDPYLLREIHLRGFDEQDILTLWQHVTGSVLQEGLVSELHAVTTGNPLAVRSALRGAMRNGTADAREFANPTSPEVIAGLFRQGASRFGEGLAVHLLPAEREALSALSWLGEVFSEEAATSLLGPDIAERKLESLRFKGMLTESMGSAQPVQTRVSTRPLLAFTHSLVHRQFLEGTEPDVDRIVRLLSAKAPLYSRLPLDLLAQGIERCTADADVLGPALIQIRHCAGYADHTIEWKYGMEYFRLAEHLFRMYTDRFSEPDREYFEAWLHVHRAAFARRTVKLLPELVKKGMDVTDGKSLIDQRWGALRINALSHSCMLDDSPANSLRSFEEAAEILAVQPELGRQQPVVTLLRFLAYRAVGNDDRELLRWIERQLDILELDPESGPWWGLGHIFICVAFAYETPEEFVRYERLYRRTERPALWQDVRALYPLSRWLFDAGYVDRFLAQAHSVVGLYRRHNAVVYVVLNQGLQYLLEYVSGDAVEEILPRLAALPYATMPDNGACHLYHYSQLCSFALLCGDRERALAAAEVNTDLPSRILLDMSDDLFPADEQVDDDPDMARFRSGVRKILAEDREEALSGILSLLREPVLRINDPVRVLAVLHLAEKNGFMNVPDVRTAATGSLLSILSWLSQPERVLLRPMRFVLKAYRHLLDDEQFGDWMQVLQSLEDSRREHPGELVPEPTGRDVRLQMIGEIQVQMPGEETRRLKGERVRACLGALVVDHVLSRPLDPVDFLRLATGENDPVHARKILKVGLFRTREAVGADALLSEGERVRLDLSRVSVDLLDMVEFVRRAEECMQKGVLSLSVRYALNAMDVYGGEVMFPTLYDPVFEGVRDELEGRIRELLVSLAGRLLEEGDAHSAEQLLRRGIVAMPEDEEVAELLRSALVAQGYYGDARLVKAQD